MNVSIQIGTQATDIDEWTPVPVLVISPPQISDSLRTTSNEVVEELQKAAARSTGWKLSIPEVLENMLSTAESSEEELTITSVRELVKKYAESGDTISYGEEVHHRAVNIPGLIQITSARATDKQAFAKIKSEATSRLISPSPFSIQQNFGNAEFEFAMKSELRLIQR